jgi:hypothetical protein
VALELDGIPTVSVHTNIFARLCNATALAMGIPRLRQTYVPQPVVDRSPADLRAYIDGTDPVSKRPFMQGVIDGLNTILDLAVAEYRGQGGTWVIPGRGRLSDTADVASYRNMVTMVRDRVRDLKAKGMTLEQVQAARPTMDFDGRYGSTTGPWTTRMFVEAVYRTLQEKKK